MHSAAVHFNLFFIYLFSFIFAVYFTSRRSLSVSLSPTRCLSDCHLVALLCGLQRHSCYFFAPISIWWLQQQRQQQQWPRRAEQTPCRAPFSSCFLKRKRKRFSYACARTPIHVTPGMRVCCVCVSACRSVVKLLLCVCVCVCRCWQYETGLAAGDFLWAANPTALLTVCQLLEGGKVTGGSIPA